MGGCAGGLTRSSPDFRLPYRQTSAGAHRGSTPSLPPPGSVPPTRVCKAGDFSSPCGAVSAPPFHESKNRGPERLGTLGLGQWHSGWVSRVSAARGGAPAPHPARAGQRRGRGPEGCRPLTHPGSRPPSRLAAHAAGRRGPGRKRSPAGTPAPWSSRLAGRLLSGRRSALQPCPAPCLAPVGGAARPRGVGTRPEPSAGLGPLTPAVACVPASHTGGATSKVQIRPDTWRLRLKDSCFPRPASPSPRPVVCDVSHGGGEGEMMKMEKPPTPPPP